jgi:hypothetical protein
LTQPFTLTLNITIRKLPHSKKTLDSVTLPHSEHCNPRLPHSEQCNRLNLDGWTGLPLKPPRSVSRSALRWVSSLIHGHNGIILSNSTFGDNDYDK